MTIRNWPRSDDSASDTFARLFVKTSDGVPTKDAGDKRNDRQRVTINVSILCVSPVSLSTNSALSAISHGDRRAPVENHTSHGSDGSSSGNAGRSHSRKSAKTLPRRAFLRLSFALARDRVCPCATRATGTGVASRERLGPRVPERARPIVTRTSRSTPLPPAACSRTGSNTEVAAAAVRRSRTSGRTWRRRLRNHIPCSRSAAPEVVTDCRSGTSRSRSCHHGRRDRSRRARRRGDADTGRTDRAPTPVPAARAESRPSPSFSSTPRSNGGQPCHCHRPNVQRFFGDPRSHECAPVHFALWHSRAPVAQWIERRTSNPLVGGSTPSGRAESSFVRSLRLVVIAGRRMSGVRGGRSSVG